MDYAVYLGDRNIAIYKKGQGIVLNKSSVINDEYPIVGGRISNIEFASKLIKDSFKSLGVGLTVYSKTKVLFCVPCSLEGTEIADYKRAVYCSGVPNAEFVPAVVAGALGNGYKLNDGVCLSIHIGEGGTDIAVIANGGIVVGGSISEGGLETTTELAKYMEEKHKICVNERAIEIARNEVQTLLLNNEISYKVTGVDPESGVSKQFWLTGIESYDVVMPIYSKIVKASKQILAELPREIIEKIENDGLSVYVGGECSNVTGLREFLMANLDMNIAVDVHSINSSINGAGALLDNQTFLKQILSLN